MDKVVVTKSKIDSLAQHINEKAGTTGAKTIAQMQATVDGIKVGGELQTKTVTGNGTYTPDSGYDGFSQFEVAVSNLLAENIRRCANVGGVEGAYFQPEIWVFNEKLTTPGTTVAQYTGLSFLSPALFALTANLVLGNIPNLAIGHTLQINYDKAKGGCRIVAIGETVAYMDIDVSIPAGESATGIIKDFPKPPSGFFDKTTGWWGKANNNRYPNQIGRVIVFLKAPEGDFLTWLQANATKCQSIDRDFISRDYQNTTNPFADDPLFQLIESEAAETKRGAKEITKNGKYTILPAAPYAAMYSAAVNVNVPVPSVQDTKAVTITSNGTVSVTPDAPYDALKKVDVTVTVAPGSNYGLITYNGSELTIS